jgi:hypothetical protein
MISIVYRGNWRWQKKKKTERQTDRQTLITFQGSSSLQKIVSEGGKRFWKSHVKCGTNKKQLMQA